MSKKQTYIGRVSTVRAEEHLGFIAISSVTKDDGSPSRLKTDNDIFVHQDDCDAVLRTGLEVGFQVIPDKKREGSYRATNVAERNVLHGELVSADRMFESVAANPRSLYVPPTSRQANAKPVSREEVEAVLKNLPMPRMPRGNERLKGLPDYLRNLADGLFPQLATIGGAAEIASGAFAQTIADMVRQHESLGLEQQKLKLKTSGRSYEALHRMAQDRSGLLLPETIIPIEYLPDLFMAVPVWYFWMSPENTLKLKRQRSATYLQWWEMHEFFRDVLPYQRWLDTFLLFNRRVRSLADYEGDLIPLNLMQRMQELAPVLDYLVIMTPYHDVVKEDWGNPSWFRNVDPYVVGFAKGVPFMFMIGRFSDSGVFPLHAELVADTIAFIRQNLEKLSLFSREGFGSSVWMAADDLPESKRWGKYVGPTLIEHGRKLLAAFDRGELFDWMRSPTDEQKQQT